MNTARYILVLCLLGHLWSCGPDTPTAQGPAAQAEVIQKNPKPVAAAQTKPATAPTPAAEVRATENMKVSYDGKEISSPSPAKKKAIEITRQQVEKKKQPTPKPRVKPADLPAGALPEPCDLITAEEMADILKIVAARDLYVKDGSGKSPLTSSSRACFYKWEYRNNPNAGVLVQVQRNPYPEEFPEWASYYISSKRNQGDKMPDGETTYRYKEFPGMGIAGAYSYDLSRYTWRTTSDHIIMVAFNLDSAEAEELIWAEKIGKIVEKNFLEIINKK